MEFFYPNFQNDFWRIAGLVYFDDKQHFIVPDEKRFDIERITEFCTEKGLAFFDTATKVCRLKDNASDNFLQIVEPTDIALLLSQMPQCHDIVTTGGKASEEHQQQIGFPMPKIGEYSEGTFADRQLRWWRMPSTSRAYPLSLNKKAECYKRIMT